MNRFWIAATLAVIVATGALTAGAQTLDYANAAYRPVAPARLYQDRAGQSAARDPASGHFIQVSRCFVSLRDGACVAKVNASTGAVIWTQFVYWGGDNDEPVLAVDSSGNAFVAQHCREAGGFGYCLARLQAATGAIQWTATLDETVANVASAHLALDPAGNPILAGTCRQSAYDEPCIAKFNGGTGALSWSRTLVWTQDSVFQAPVHAVAVDGSGNVVVAGACSLGTQTLNACAEKLSGTTGGTLWQGVYGASGDDRFRNLALFANGDVAATGTCNGVACIYRLAAATGSVLWQGQSAGFDSSYAARVDPSGHVVYLVDCIGLNDSSICLERRNGSTGSLMWSSTNHETSGATSGIDLVTSAAGHVFVTGACRPSSNPIHSACTLRFDGATGALVWAGYYSSAPGSFNRGFTVVLDAAGNPATFGNCLLGVENSPCAVKYAAASNTVQWSFAAGASHFAPAVIGQPATPQREGAFGRHGGFTYTTFSCGDSGLSLCVMKTNEATGATVWVSRFDGEGPEPTGGGLFPTTTGPGIAFSPAGDPIVGGTCSVNPSDHRLCARKLSAATGAAIWTSKFLSPGGGIASGRSIATDASGDAYVTGTCRGVTLNDDICTVRFSGSTGAVLWSRFLGGFGNDEGVAVAVSGGTVVATGRCANGASGDDICTAAYATATGTLLWQAAFDGPAGLADQPVALATTGGAAFVAGRCSAGAQDNFCTLKYDLATGVRSWAATYAAPGNADDKPVAIAVGPDGHPVVAGTCYPNPGNPVFGDLCTVKYSSATGLTLWSRIFVTGFSNVARDLAIDPLGNPVVAGECAPDTSGRVDLCLLKLAGTNGTQRGLYTLASPGLGTGVARRVIAADGKLYVAADWAPRFESPGVRILRLSNDVAGPAVSNVALASPNFTSLTSLSFDVTFSEPVTGVDASDFALELFGETTGAAITSVVGSGTTWTVTFNRGTGTGQIRLHVLDNDTIVDASLNPMGGPGVSPPYTSLVHFVVLDPIDITTTSLPNGSVGVPYSVTLQVANALPPVSWSITSGGLPAGLVLDGETGAITGTPTGAGSGNFLVSVLDDFGRVDSLLLPMTINPGPQAITFAALPDRAIGTGPFALAATGGGSGLPVTFASITPAVCTATGTNGTTLTLLAVGTCTIRASQAGNANWLAATSVDRSFSVLASTMTLTVGKTGSGTVTSNPAGINCGATCSASFTTGASVSLGAVPATGFVFSNWTGACTGTGACTVTMSAARSVTAVFVPVSFALTVAKAGTGQGGVLSAPAGIDCGTLCAANFTNGTAVTLTATAASGSTFTGWGGACTGTGTCQVTMDAARSVSASFALQPAQYVLSVVNATPISGRVQSTPGGIDCGIALICSDTFAAGTVVTLTASPSPHWAFGSWSGACTGSGACQVTMDAARSVTVNWVPAPSQFVLSVVNPTPISGRVQSSPGGIDCGIALICSDTFAAGTVVTLTASPSPNFFFAGWTGGGCSGTAPCQVTMDAARTVSAEFKRTSTIPRLANISTRMQVLTGNDVLIGGFIIGGTQPKTVVVRARGPSLIPLGVPNALANPVLQLFSGATQIDANDNWQQAANAATIQSSGFAPSDPLESAIYTTLNPGAYTAIVTGANLGTGVAIIEVFEVDRPEVPLLNIATRGKVLTGGDVMIGGFIIQGDAPQTVVVRARGPSLTAAGVPGALQDTVLQLFAGPTVIASNDDWQASPDAATIQAAGFAPSDPRESVIRITLNPGAYTAIVTGKNNTTGVGIIEVFAQ